MEEVEMISKACRYTVEWLRKNWIIVSILILGAFLRLYRIDDYMTFLGDEGRDVLVVRNLLVNFDPILIGPGTSVGSMYLGPLYYYFMAPFLLLWNFSPIGPAVGVALLGVATIYLVYAVGFEWFSKKAGLIAASLFALSPTVILYSRSSWNPNIMPFFALLSIYSIWKVYSQKKFIWLIMTAISFAFVLQSHYLGVLLLPILIIYYFLTIRQLRVTSYGFKNSPLATRHFITRSFVGLFIFLMLMSPLLIFDLRHNFLNSKALYKFLTVRQETVTFKPVTIVKKIYPIFEQVNTSLLVAKNEPAGKVVTVVLTLLVLLGLFFRKRLILHHTSYIPLLWLASGVLGLAIYSQSINDHYFGFLFPAPFLLVGFLIDKVINTKYKILGILVFVILIVLNLNKNPFSNNPNNQMRRAQNVANKVIDISGNKPFNIAVLSDWNYEDGYQYFLEKENSKLSEIDSQRPDTVTDQLLVICENLRDKCDPTHSAKAEVANFGWSKVDSEYEVDGVIIFKLVHTN